MSLLNIIYIIFGALIILGSSTYVVRSLTQLAHFFGLSGFTISFILMAFATSIPELIIGINAAISGSPEISLGNILGTNIVNLTLVLGLVALISGRIVMDDYQRFSTNRLFNFFLVMSPVVLLLDGYLSRIDAVILLAFFGWSLAHMLEFRKHIKGKTFRGFWKTTVANAIKGVLISTKSFFKNLFVFVAGIAALTVASHYFIIGAKNISISFGLSEILIGVFVVGLGTSLPELAFGIKAAKSKQGGMSLGNIFGSSVVNSTLILGITALIAPITISDTSVFWVSVIFMGFTMLLAYYLLRSKDFLIRTEGLVLILIYAIFIVVQGAFCFSC